MSSPQPKLECKDTICFNKKQVALQQQAAKFKDYESDSDSDKRSGELTIEKTCKNPQCLKNFKEFPVIHRHSTDGCKDHIFCAQDPQPFQLDSIAVQDLWTKEDVAQRNEQLREAAHHAQGCGGAKGEGAEPREPFSNILGDDRFVAEDRRVVVSDPALDTWLAAHYGLTLDKLPPGRPANMSKGVHERLKKGVRALYKENFLMGQEQKKQNKRKQSRESSNEDSYSPPQNAQPGSFGNQIQYQFYPAQSYKHVTCPADSKIQSNIDIHLEEENQKLLKSKQEKRKEKKHSRGRSVSKRNVNLSSIVSETSETRSQVNRSSVKFQNTNETGEIMGDVDEQIQESEGQQPGQYFVIRKPCSVTFKDEDQKYRLPDPSVLSRINSKPLQQCMAKPEIEKYAFKQQKALDRRRQMNIQEEGNKVQKNAKNAPTQGQEPHDHHHTPDVPAKEELNFQERWRKQHWPKQKEKASSLTIENMRNLRQLLKMKKIQSSLKFQTVAKSNQENQMQEQIKTGCIGKNSQDTNRLTDAGGSYAGIENASTAVGSKSQTFSHRQTQSIPKLTLLLDERQKAKDVERKKEIQQSLSNFFKPSPQILVRSRQGAQHPINKARSTKSVHHKRVGAFTPRSRPTKSSVKKLDFKSASYGGGAADYQSMGGSSTQNLRGKITNLDQRSNYNTSRGYNHQKITLGEEQLVSRTFRGQTIQTNVEEPFSHYSSTAGGGTSKEQAPANLATSKNVRGAMSAKKNLDISKLFQQAISNRLRIKNEIITGRIIREQAALQNKLSYKYCLTTERVNVPVYMKIQNMALATPKENPATQKPASKPAPPAQSTNQSEQKVPQDKANKPQDPNQITWRAIKSQFGLAKQPQQKSKSTARSGMNNNKIQMDDDEQQENSQEEFGELCAELQQQLEETILNEINNETIQIHKKIEEEKEEEEVEEKVTLMTKKIKFDLCINTNHKDFKDPVFWMKLAQKRQEVSGSAEAGLDYLRNGLRELPLDYKLIYNYACSNEEIGNYEKAKRFFQYAQQIRPKWADAIFGEAINHFKQRNFKQAKKCVKLAIRRYKNGNLQSVNVMLYFQAMCYKNLGKYNKARRDYGALKVYFNKDENSKIFSHIIGLILLPLETNLLKKHNFMENTLQLMAHFQHSQAPEKEKKLELQINKQTGYLNMDKNGFIIIKYLKDQPFFTRFDVLTLQKFLKYGKPESFKKEEIIFLNTKGVTKHDCGKRVGIITYGSVMVYSHSQGVLSPYTEQRHGVGKILGHESDRGVTTNSENWIITYDEGTEILFFEKSVFNKLWNIQFQKTDKQIIEANIECNPLLRCLSDQSQYQIIYEDMVIRKFRPGQLICRMSKRSKVNSHFSKYYKSKTNNFLEEVNDEKRHQHIKETVEGCAATSGGHQVYSESSPTDGETVVSGFVKKLTDHKCTAGIRRIQAKYDNDIVLEEEEPVEDPDRETDEDTQSQSDQRRNISPRASNIEINKQKTNKDTFAEMQALQAKYNDTTYKEVDGIYIIYQGNVDVVNPVNRQKIHSIQIFENFGESKVIQKASYEQFGDLYAGLYPSNIKKRRVHRKHTGACGAAHVQELDDREDVVICLFIPYRKFMNISTTEIRAIKEKACLLRTNPGVFNHVSIRLGIDQMDLQQY